MIQALVLSTIVGLLVGAVLGAMFAQWLTYKVARRLMLRQLERAKSE